MTQAERILEYMDTFGSITPFQAFADLGITKLSTRISEMRKSGIGIADEMMYSKNRYGEPTHYKKYWRTDA